MYWQCNLMPFIFLYACLCKITSCILNGYNSFHLGRNMDCNYPLQEREFNSDNALLSCFNLYLVVFSFLSPGYSVMMCKYLANSLCYLKRSQSIFFCNTAPHYCNLVCVETVGLCLKQKELPIFFSHLIETSPLYLLSEILNTSITFLNNIFI